MQATNFVYLDNILNRLLIVPEPIDNKDFHLLMNNKGENSFKSREILLTLCKMFCIGYIICAGNKKQINDLNEFK